MLGIIIIGDPKNGPLPLSLSLFISLRISLIYCRCLIFVRTLGVFAMFYVVFINVYEFFKLDRSNVEIRTSYVLFA